MVFKTKQSLLEFVNNCRYEYSYPDRMVQKESTKNKFDMLISGCRSFLIERICNRIFNTFDENEYFAINNLENARYAWKDIDGSYIIGRGRDVYDPRKWTKSLTVKKAALKAAAFNEMEDYLDKSWKNYLKNNPLMIDGVLINHEHWLIQAINSHVIIKENKGGNCDDISAWALIELIIKKYVKKGMTIFWCQDQVWNHSYLLLCDGKKIKYLDAWLPNNRTRGGDYLEIVDCAAHQMGTDDFISSAIYQAIVVTDDDYEESVDKLTFLVEMATEFLNKGLTEINEIPPIALLRKHDGRFKIAEAKSGDKRTREKESILDENFEDKRLLFKASTLGRVHQPLKYRVSRNTASHSSNRSSRVQWEKDFMDDDYEEDLNELSGFRLI